MPKLNKSTVDGAKPKVEGRYTIFDSEVKGFALRITPSGQKTYALKYRVAGLQRMFTIGRHGSPWTPEEARKEAIRLLGDVSRGVDPADKRNADRKAIKFADLCNLYLAEGVAHKKASTVRSDRGRIEHHLKPLLGAKRVDAIGRADIEKLLNDVKSGRTKAKTPAKRPPGSLAKGGAGVSSQCVLLASTILQFAMDRGLRSDNPARGVKRPPVRRLQRFLSEAELGRLAEALDYEIASSGNVFVVAAIRLLVLTGCRRNEVVALRWRSVDFERGLLLLDDSKTGEKTVYLSPPALAILSALPRIAGNDFCIAGDIAGKPFAGIDKIWSRVRARAGLADIRLHDLRHSYASVGAAASLGLPIIGKLLGHSQAQTTARYAHLSDDPLRRAANTIGAIIDGAMASRKGAAVIPLHPAKESA